MQNTLTLLLLLQLPFLNAQSSYHPMLVEGRSWDIFHLPPDGAICGFGSAGNYFLRGDSVLDGLTYKQVWYYPIRSNPPAPFCSGFYRDTTESYFFKLVREDTIARKVYHWTSDNNEGDEILYDFSLKAGDTLHYPFASYPILTVTDWVLTNGEHRKAFEISNWSQNYYVEGVGYLLGQFGQVFYPFEVWSVLTCMRDGEEQVYKDPFDNDPGCVLATSAAHTPEIFSFNISPNPFSNYLILKVPEGRLGVTFVLELYDLAGRVAFRRAIKPDSVVFSVDLPPLPQGIYGWAVNGVLQGKLARI
ncbi:MAG: T9SS type A sorting domain-containing protein [Phycisphaerae bacterium]|nr:T9SS type A sorting domain-containing protein [Saprospiraceae bacterium]